MLYVWNIDNECIYLEARNGSVYSPLTGRRIPNDVPSCVNVEMTKDGGFFIRYRSRQEMGKIFMLLRDAGVPFAVGHYTWTALSDFEFLREEGLASGKVESVTWIAMDKMEFEWR